jgi:hypothetical protein
LPHFYGFVLILFFIFLGSPLFWVMISPFCFFRPPLFAYPIIERASYTAVATVLKGAAKGVFAGQKDA